MGLSKNTNVYSCYSEKLVDRLILGELFLELSNKGKTHSHTFIG